VINYLSNHHSFVSKQSHAAGSLIVKGRERMRDSRLTVEGLFTQLNTPPDMKKQTDQLTKGNAALKANVEFG
jgi:hypothetical protein